MWVSKVFVKGKGIAEAFFISTSSHLFKGRSYVIKIL
jgi:hypothetical protein